MRKAMSVCMVCALLVGCDYTVPLVKTPDADIDAAVVGLWQRSWDDGRISNSQQGMSNIQMITKQLD